MKLETKIAILWTQLINEGESVWEEGRGGECVANLLRRVLIAKSSQNQSLSHKAAEHTVDTTCDN